MLETPVGTVKGRMRLGLKKMREALAHGSGRGMSTGPDHERWEDAAGTYVLGALPDDERAGYEAHLDDCPACRAEVDGAARGRRGAAGLAAADAARRPR